MSFSSARYLLRPTGAQHKDKPVVASVFLELLCVFQSGEED